MNLESVIIIFGIYFVIWCWIYHIKIIRKYIVWWILFGLLCLCVFLYRQNLLGDFGIIEGPKYNENIQSNKIEKEIRKPEINSERYNIWEDSKKEFRQIIKEY